jgi:hypothetical protein
MKPILLTLLFALVLLPASSSAVDPFYQGLFREGVQQYERGDHAASARTLRLACFGMLEEPTVLAGCLSRLALAQDRAGDDEGFQDTFRRLSEVEERFQGYTRSDLPPELRTALEQRLAARIPAATLRSIPAFAALAGRGAEARPAGDGKTRRQAQKKSAPANQPISGRQEPVAGGPAPAEAPAPAPPRPLTAEEHAKMAGVRQLLTQEGNVKALREAFESAREIADAHPESVEAQHLAAEAAYRISRWEDSARYFKRGGEPGADQPELQFYMAVALFESGDVQGAATILKRSLPNLQRTPYVDAYARKILG